MRLATSRRERTHRAVRHIYTGAALNTHGGSAATSCPQGMKSNLSDKQIIYIPNYYFCQGLQKVVCLDRDLHI
jgi:hypothetical protein